MATIRETFVLEDRITQPLNQILNAYRQCNQAAEAMTSHLRAAEQAASAARPSVDRLGDEIQEMGTRTRAARSNVDSLVTGLGRLAKTFLGVQAVKGLVTLSDTMTQTTARLDMMNDGLQTTAELNQMIYESAQRSRGSYQQTADMVAKLGNLAGDAFNSSAELVDFAEQLNKQITLSGASTQAADAAMLQLTQAMSSGMLRGEELNSILEQTPTIAQSIAKYMGVSTGEMRELASEGAITADVVKNALFNAAEETNAKFAEMPMTWAQVWTSAKNIGTRAIQPVLNAINSAANHVGDAVQWVKDNIELVEGALAGLAAGAVAVGTYMAASAITTAAVWAAANWPLLAIVAAVGLMIFTARQAGATWQEIGGVIGGVFGAMYAFAMNNFIVPAQRAFATLVNFIGNVFNDPVTAVKVLFYDMAITVLGYIRSLVGGIEDLINAIPGVQVSLTSGINGIYNSLQANREAAIAAGSYKEFVKPMEYLDIGNTVRSGYDTGSSLGDKLSSGLSSFLSSATSAVSAAASAAVPTVPTYDQVAGEKLDDIGKSTSSIEKAVNMSEEDLKSLVDTAERRYVANVNLMSQTPVIQISGQNTGNTEADRRSLANTIRDILMEQVASGSTRSTARAY